MKHIEFREGKLLLLDQRRLPLKQEIYVCDTVGKVFFAIRELVVRGAPAIGVAAAYGMVISFLEGEKQGLNPAEIREKCLNDGEYLKKSRPTAVNLFWAVDRMAGLADGIVSGFSEAALREADMILEEDIDMNRRMGEAGSALIPYGSTVLTHCNAGALATGGYGTALGIIRSAYAQGRVRKVYADETRPLLQGARLTAWELVEDGIPCTLICDSMAAHVMQKGLVDCVVTGADRIAANGDVANKIGTYGLSVLAREHGIPFYVAAPVSTFDFSISTGGEIPIEERDPSEVKNFGGTRTAPPDVDVYNPAFDVTPAGNITAIITERGVLKGDYSKAIKEMYGDA